MNDKDFIELRNEIIRAGNYAVRMAQKENLEKGIPNVYDRNGRLYYELPSGEITSETPEAYKESEAAYNAFKLTAASRKKPELKLKSIKA